MAILNGYVMWFSDLNIIPLQKIFTGIEMFVGGFPKPQFVFLMEQQKGRLATNSSPGIESAHVVVLAHANHYVFRSNEADVLREMNSLLAGLQ